MFSLILEKHAPLHKKRVSEKFCPWLTKNHKIMSVARDKIKKQAVCSNSEILMQAHWEMLNKVNKLNTESKRKYFSKKNPSHKGDLKNTRKTSNLVLNIKLKTMQITSIDVHGKLVYDNKAIAESMNDFFCNTGKNLSDELPQTQNPLLESRFSANEHNLRFEFQAVNIARVEKVFGKFKNSLGFSTDGIANHFLKLAHPVIGKSLCDIFNLSIATGVFPDCWKIARVASIFKSGQSVDRSNYMPISVLPSLSRVF